MRHLSTTVSLLALALSAGIASAQAPTAPERPNAQQQQRQPGGSDERQPNQAQQPRDQDRQRGQAQQQDQDRQRGQAQQEQDQQRQQPSVSGQPNQQRPSQAQDQQQQQRQPNSAQQPQNEDRQRGQAQQQDQRQQQPSVTGQPNQPQQQRANQAQDQQQQRQQPSTAQQQQPAGSGEVSARIASNPEVSTRIEQSVTRINPVSVNVDVRVGGSIPRTVELHPVPQAIIEIAPRYREYRVIRVREEIVIVNPRSYEVVEVIRISGNRSAQRAQQRLELSAQQRQLILRHARQAREARVTTEVRVTEGRPLEQRVELHTIPQEIITEVPTLREYRYFVTGEQVVIVDPSSNMVTEVIR